MIQWNQLIGINILYIIKDSHLVRCDWLGDVWDSEEEEFTDRVTVLSRKVLISCACKTWPKEMMQSFPN